MRAEPGSTEAQLEALRRFFLLRYDEEVRRRYLAFHQVFPLVGASRLDLVQVNGGRRAYFFYGRGSDGEHLVVVHDLTVEAADASPEAELAFVRRAVGVEGALVHFVLEPPYGEQFDRIEAEVMSAVERHARRRPEEW